MWRRDYTVLAGWMTVIGLLFILSLWLSRREEVEWATFVKEHQCTLFSSRKSMSYDVTSNRYNSDGTITTTTETWTQPGEEIWECLGPEGIDTYHRWK